MIKGHNPNIRLIISFADSEQNHHGGIYQATNFLYVGSSTVTQKLINGRWRNDVHTHRWNIVSPTRKAPPKHKYLYPLDKAMRRQILPLAKPYPKKDTCGQSVKGDTPEPTGEQVQSLMSAP